MSTLCFQLSRDVAENLAYGQQQQQQQQQQQHNYYNTGTIITLLLQLIKTINFMFNLTNKTKAGVSLSVSHSDSSWFIGPKKSRVAGNTTLPIRTGRP